MQTKEIQRVYNQGKQGQLEKKVWGFIQKNKVVSRYAKLFCYSALLFFLGRFCLIAVPDTFQHVLSHNQGDLLLTIKQFGMFAEGILLLVGWCVLFCKMLAAGQVKKGADIQGGRYVSS